MKITRKILGILLIVALVGTILISSVAAAPVTVKTIDESGALAGSIAAPVGIPSTAKNIEYLSARADADALVGTDTKYYKDKTYEPNANMVYLYPGSKDPNGVGARKQIDSRYETTPRSETVYGDSAKTDFYFGNIHLGGYATYYEKGISVQPNADKSERGLVFATNGANYFYSVVGGTGGNVTHPDKEKGTYSVVFKVYGGNSKDGEFTELATTGNIEWWYTAEFNVDVSAYSYIKLSCFYTGSASDMGTTNSAWGNACLYKVDPPATTTEGTTATTGATTGTTAGTTSGTTAGGSSSNDTPSKTADSFTMTAVAALVLGAASVTALVVSKKKFF